MRAPGPSSCICSALPCWAAGWVRAPSAPMTHWSSSARAPRAAWAAPSCRAPEAHRDLVGPSLAGDAGEERRGAIDPLNHVECRRHFPATIRHEAYVAGEQSRERLDVAGSGGADERRQQLLVSGVDGGRHVWRTCHSLRPCLAHPCPATARELTAGRFVPSQRRRDLRAVVCDAATVGRVLARQNRPADHRHVQGSQITTEPAPRDVKQPA